MTTNCSCSNVKNPAGIWEYFQLIGAKVYIRSTPVSNFFNLQNSSSQCTIKDIYFRLSIDGKTITVVELEEYPGKIFTWKDLLVSELVNGDIVKPICGEFVCGTGICGLEVDKAASYADAISGGGIAIIDDNGNIISSRMIRFIGASVEDILTDTDEITDVSIDKLTNINGGTF